MILCERGIRSFDTMTRNLFDLTAIPIVQRLSHLPMIADPSHGTGLRDKVIPDGTGGDRGRRRWGDRRGPSDPGPGAVGWRASRSTPTSSPSSSLELRAIG